MIRAFLALVAVLILAGCSTSARVTYLPATQPVPAEKVDLAAYEARYPGLDGVFLEHSTTIEHVTLISYIGNFTEWAAYETVQRHYLVLNKDATWLTTFSLTLDGGSELERVELVVTHPDGKRDTYGPQELQVQEATGNAKIRKLIYKNIERGAIVSESFVLKRVHDISRASNLDRELQFSIPCEKLSFRFLYPDSWTIKVKHLAQGQTLATTESTNAQANKRILAYEAKDVPALLKEPYAPFTKEVSTYLRLMVTKGWGSPAFESWDRFSELFRSFAMKKDPVLSQRVVEATRLVTRDLQKPREILEGIVGFVQDTVTVGQGEANDNFADTLKKKKGNVYQITGLTASMLRQAGIPSDYILIHSAREGHFDKDFISFEEIYIPALRVVLEDKTYLIQPYIKHLPIDIIPEFIQARTALLIPGAAGPATFITTPEGNLADNTVEETYKVTLDPDGRVFVSETKVLRGTDAYSVRKALEDLKKDETETLLKKLLTYTEGTVAFKSYAFDDLADFKKPLGIRLEYTIDNLLTVTPEEVLFHTGGLFSPSSSQKVKVSVKERQNPIRIYNDERKVKHIQLTFPAAWSLERAPQDQKLENAFGTVEGTFRSAPGTLAVEQSLTLRKVAAPREGYQELLDLLGRNSSLALKSLVFRVNPPK